MKNYRYLVPAAALAMGVAGCHDPLSRDDSRTVERQIIEANRRQIAELSEAPQVEVVRSAGESYITPEYIEKWKLDQISGKDRFKGAELDMGRGLDGKDSSTARLTLEQAVRIAVRNNLDVQLAQLQPAASEAEVARAEAAFDAVFFADTEFYKVDQPRTIPIVAGTPVSTPINQSDTARLETGIRKPLESGGRATVSTGFDYINNKTPNLAVFPDPSFTNNVFLGLEQPLLRNFGTEVNRAEIYLTRNAHQRDVLALHAQLLQTVADVEAAYWELAFARHRLAVQMNLLDLTLSTWNKIKERQRLDASPIQMAQAQTFVDGRRQEVVNARRAVRDASDELKRLLHAPELPVSDETLIVPADDPIELPLTFSLLDAVTTSLNHRPEVRAALVDIDDASIRQMVADNQRLPVLNLNASIRYYGLDDDFSDAYERLGEGEFIEYLIGGQFEAPIGNRAAEAAFRRTRIERQIAVVRYQQAVQTSVVEVKSALRELTTSWELIGMSRATRRAAADNYRALIEREEKGEPLTPEFLLDLKLNTQARLAESELSEMRSIVDYNVALTRLQQATGTLLEHNQIQFNYDVLYENDRKGKK